MDAEFHRSKTIQTQAFNQANFLACLQTKLQFMQTGGRNRKSRQSFHDHGYGSLTHLNIEILGHITMTRGGSDESKIRRPAGLRHPLKSLNKKPVQTCTGSCWFSGAVTAVNDLSLDQASSFRSCRAEKSTDTEGPIVEVTYRERQ